MSKRTQTPPGADLDVVLLQLEDRMDGGTVNVFLRDCTDAQMQLFDRLNYSSCSDQIDDNYCVEAVSDVIALLRSANVPCNVDDLASQYDDLSSWTSDDHADFERAVEARCKELLADAEYAKQNVSQPVFPVRLLKMVCFSYADR